MRKIITDVRTAFLAVNSLSILISIIKILFFITEFFSAFFTWWLPGGRIFSYIHFYKFFVVFLLEVPFGVYFIALLFYLLATTFLLMQARKKSISKKMIFISVIMLIAVIGSWILFIGE